MRTEQVLAVLESELQRNCGDVFAAAQAAGVSLIFVAQWRKDDKIVDDRLTEAARVGAQKLVSAAIQRAVNGVDEDVYYKGAIVGHKTVYSDSLLTTLLKAKVPEFGKDTESNTNITVNVANVVPRADSYEEWLRMKDATLKPSLPAPAPQITDATFTEVSIFDGIDL